MIRKAGLQEYAWLVQDNHVVPSSRAPHTYIYTHEAGRAGRKRPLPPGGLTITTEGGGHFWTENGQSGAAPAGTEGVFACSARDAQGELLLGKCFRRARLKRHVTDRSVKKADVDYIDNYSLLHLGVRELTEQRAFVNQQHAAEAMGMSGIVPGGFGYGAAPNPAANNGHTTLPPGITGGQPDPSAELAVSETCGGIVVSDDAPEATAVEEFTAPGAAQNGFDHPEAAPAAEPEPKRQHVECAEEESLQSPMREPSQTETQILTETSMTDTGEAIVLWPAMPNPAPTMADADMDEAAPEDELREAVAQLEEAVKQLKEQFPPPLLPAPPAAGVNL